MEIIDVLWEGRSSDEPHRLVSLLNTQRFETRKLEFFRSGEVGSASESHKTTRTALGSMAVPSLEEINADPEFSGKPMLAPEFEQLWSHHGRSLELYEVAILIGTPPNVPMELFGANVAVLLAYESNSRLAYEVESVAEDGSTLWQGVVAREHLKALSQNAA